MKCGVCKKSNKTVDHVRQCSAASYGKSEPAPADTYNESARRSAAATVGNSFTVGAKRAETNHLINQRPGGLPPEDKRVYLNVPFKDNKLAKTEFGARWDADRRKWFVSDDADFGRMPPAWMAEAQKEPQGSAETPNVIVDGIYRMYDSVGEDGEIQYAIFKVVKAVHGSGNPYAKKLVVEIQEDGKNKGSWAYAPRAVRDLRPEMLMSKEDQMAYGKLYGICVRCGATLTNEESIERGMGIVCAGK